MTGGRSTDLRLLPAVALAWLAAGIAVGLPASPTLPMALGAAALLTALLARRIRSWPGLLAVALTAAALVTASEAAQAPARSPAILAEAARSGRAISLQAEATSRVTDGRLTATVLATRVGDRVAPVSTPVLVMGEPGDRVLGTVTIGALLRVDGTLHAADPGEGVAFVVFPRGSPLVLAPPPPLLAAADAVRVAFVRATAGLPGDGGDLLPGLAIGDTAEVGPGLSADMKASSLSHLTAVSGANCAIVVGLAFAVAAGIGMPRLARAVAAALVLTAFVVLVTPQGSVIRAAVMAAVGLLAFALGRSGRGLPMLCVAVIVLLTVDPWLSRDYGFALSALATAGLIVLAGPIATVIARLLPHWLALMLAVPIAAQLACQPVILLLNPALPVYGVAANLLAEPAAPLVTVLGLVCCLAAPLLPPLATAVGWLAWLPASWIATVATFFAGLPGAQSPWPSGAVGVALLVFVTVAGLAAVLGGIPPRVQRIARATMVVAIVGYLASVGGTRLVQTISRPADWEYALCDVGQGDATLIRSGDRIALVDTGPQPAALAACLQQLGISRLDLLVLTHYDLDHVGGTDAVVGKVARVLIGPPSAPGDVRLADELRQGGAQVDQVGAEESGTLGSLDWKVLWPPSRGAEPGNPASVTLSVTPGGGCPDCLSGIFLGDLGAESQARLLGDAKPGLVDVVKVAHHGSADQSQELYARLHATLGLIGVGAGNDYGHPTAKLLGILAATGTRPLRTDLDGMVLVAPGDRPHEARVWTEKSGGGETTVTGAELSDGGGG